MLPSMNAPNVTAGLTWPPETFVLTETGTNNVNAWDKNAATRPEGVAG